MPTESERSVKHRIRKVDANSAFAFSWQVFTDNLGLLIAVAFTTGVIRMLQAAIEQVARSNPERFETCMAASFVLGFVGLYLGIGQVRIALKLCRGETAEFVDVLSGGDRFVHVWDL